MDVEISYSPSDFMVEVSANPAEYGQIVEIGSAFFQPPEPDQPTTDSNLWAWYRSDVGLTTRNTTILDFLYPTYALRLTGSTDGIMWRDNSNNNHHFTNSYAFNRGSQSTPYYISNLINGKPGLFFKGPVETAPSSWTYFDDTMLQTSQSGLNSPFTVYLLFNNLNWFSNGMGTGIGNGFIYNGTSFSDPSYQFTVGLIEDAGITSPQLRVIGIESSEGIFGPYTEVPLYSWHVLTCIYNYSSSYIQVDSGLYITGSSRIINPNGLIVGNAYNSIGTLTHNNSEMYLAAMIVCTGSSNAAEREIHQNWLKWYGGLS